MWSHRRIDCEYRAAHTFAQHNCLCVRAISDIPRTCDWSHTHTPTHTHPRIIPDEVGDAGAHHNDVELFAGLRHAGVLVRRNGDDARIATTDDAVVTAMTLDNNGLTGLGGGGGGQAQTTTTPRSG